MSTPERQVTPTARRDWNQRDVVSLLLELARQLQDLDEQLAGYEKDYVEKAELHNAAHAKAFLSARQDVTEDGKPNPQYVCEVMAQVASSEEKLAMDLAKVMVQAQKRKIEILRTRIDVGRTAASSLRAELELERTPNQYRR